MTPPPISGRLDPRDLQTMFEAQVRAFAQSPYPSLAERKQHLRALKSQLHRYQDRLAEAIGQDFGARSVLETKMLDVLTTTLAINHVLRHVRSWMRPRRRSTELLFFSNSLQVRYQPKGVVGVVGTWNYPLYLSLGPLAAALAAGNRVMLKLPDNLPATVVVVRQMLQEVFAQDHVAVIGGELADPSAFTALPFNHLVLTGSPAVGKAVMAQAAQHLTPVTLELGGKSPALVLPDFDVAEAARCIAHGKGVNAGQTCVAPDYALVPRAAQAAFVEAARVQFQKLYGSNLQEAADYTGVVSDRHAARLQHLLDDARAKGAQVTACAEAGPGRRMPLYVVTGCTPDMALLQEEIFGPILPVLSYDTLEQAIAYIQQRPRPLALYCFSRDAAARERVLQHTHSGGVTLNDWGWHVMNHAAPFGGVGNSGMGSYHGEEGFRELSHARTVFKRSRFFPIALFYPPYGSFLQRLTLRLWLGKGGSCGPQVDPVPEQ